MANTIKCSECIYYNEQRKPLRKKQGGSISLNKGHCLKRTIYASNKPGNTIYPPNAKVKNLPYGRHQVVLVHKDQIQLNCVHAKKGK